MGIFDKETEFSLDQEINGDAVSTNYYDRAAADADALEGGGLWLAVTVTEAFNTLTSLDVSFISATAADLTTGQIKHHTKSIPLANLTLGNTIWIGPLGDGPTGRYLGVDYNCVGTDPTTGKVTARLTTQPQRNPPVRY
jgi:hypothetical protein